GFEPQRASILDRYARLGRPVIGWSVRGCLEKTCNADPAIYAPHPQYLLLSAQAVVIHGREKAVVAFVQRNGVEANATRRRQWQRRLRPEILAPEQRGVDAQYSSGTVGEHLGDDAGERDADAAIHADQV